MKLIALVIAAVFLPVVALACGMAWPIADSPAMMKAERALIIWDSEKKREDFIRSVDFETKSHNLGFIVPVPSIPEVADVKKDIFKALDEEMERQRPRKSRNFGGDGAVGAMSPGGAVLNSVEVVAEYKLAEFDVKVIKADSIEPLADWLKTNNFAMRPALKKWLQTYLDKKYYFTVFKFRKTADNMQFSTKTVRISFDTEKPYYPYRDSEDMITDGSRKLLLYFLSDKPYAPHEIVGIAKLDKPTILQAGCPVEGNWFERLLGPAANNVDLPLPLFSNRIKTLPELDELADQSKFNWLTVWHDMTQKRPDTDFSFVPYEMKGKVLLCP